MKCKWREVYLDDITKWSSGGTPSKNNPLYWDGTIPWISAKNMPDGWLDDAEPKITELGLNNGSKLAPPNSILMLVRGSGLYNRRYICITRREVAFNQDVKCIETTDECLPEFLYYWLRGNDTNLVSLLETTGIGAGKFDTKRLQQMRVMLPKLEEQAEIVLLLRLFDDKIKLNNKINENLQQQVHAIYQEWFGNINAAKGQGTISDICSYSKDRVAVSKLDVNTYFSTENMLPGKAGATEASSLPTTTQTTACHVGDTLISNIRPYFKKIVYCHEECGCSTDVLCVVPVHPKYSAYLYSTLYADKFFDFMVAGSKGTKMPRGDKQQIMTYPITLPTDTELERFNSVAVPILMQIQNNRNENKRLRLLRDILLPRLMSGEINATQIRI